MQSWYFFVCVISYVGSLRQKEISWLTIRQSFPFVALEYSHRGSCSWRGGGGGGSTSFISLPPPSSDFYSTIKRDHISHNTSLEFE